MTDVEIAKLDSFAIGRMALIEIMEGGVVTPRPCGYWMNWLGLVMLSMVFCSPSGSV